MAIFIEANPSDSELHPRIWALIQRHFCEDLAANIFRAVCFLLIISTALFGNSLVLIAVFRFDRLRTVRTNTFLVSLALADFLVALFVMPFSASMSLLDGHWIYGQWLCDLFNANDVFFSTASILHLCCISCERFIAVTNPLTYERKMTKFRVICILACTWIISLLISYMPIFLGIYTTKDNLENSRDDPHSCHFIVNPYYAIISSSVSFWIPSFAMIAVYRKILIEARKQEKKINNLLLIPAPQRLPLPNCYPAPEDERSADSQLGCSRRGSYFPVGSLAKTNTTESKEEFKIKRENKAAKTLGIVMGTFFLCWFPFFLWYTAIHLFCGYKHCESPPIVRDILFWIGYFNSTLNPFIYAYYNRSFRGAFKQILRCSHSERNSGQFMEATRNSARLSVIPPVSGNST